METKDVTSEYREKATPGIGTIKIEDGYDNAARKNEIAAANWLHDTFGGDVMLLKESNIVGVKTPDFEWRGKLWELKTLTTEKAADGAIRRALNQIKDNRGGVIIDYGKRKISMDKLQKVLRNRFYFSKAEDLDVIIIQDGNATVLRYKK